MRVGFERTALHAEIVEYEHWRAKVADCTQINGFDRKTSGAALACGEDR